MRISSGSPDLTEEIPASWGTSETWQHKYSLLNPVKHIKEALSRQKSDDCSGKTLTQSHLQWKSRRLKLNRKFIPDIPEHPSAWRHTLKRLNAGLMRLQLC